jgi:hypothetical protein
MYSCTLYLDPQMEKEQQWLELADYLIKRFALRRRLLADSMPA